MRMWKRKSGKIKLKSERKKEKMKEKTEQWKWKKETEKWKAKVKLHLSVNWIVSPEVIPAPTAQAFHTITWSSWKVLKVSMTFRKSWRLLKAHCSQEPLLPDVRARKADFLILFAFLSRVSRLFHFHVSFLCSSYHKSMSLSWFLIFLNLEISPLAKPNHLFWYSFFPLSLCLSL